MGVGDEVMKSFSDYTVLYALSNKESDFGQQYLQHLFCPLRYFVSLASLDDLALHWMIQMRFDFKIKVLCLVFKSFNGLHWNQYLLILSIH